MASEKRLIDVTPENIKAVLKEVPYYPDEIWKFTAMTERFPTVDAVEVVRCKNCKWFKNGTPFRHECNNICAGMFYVRQEDFCSYGERKDNERKAD